MNHDETPQFINYGVDGSAKGLVYASKGRECNKLIQEKYKLCYNLSICLVVRDCRNLSSGIQRFRNN